MIGVGLSVLYFGVSVRSFNQNLVEFRTQSGPRSMMHFYVQVCAGTDLLHSDSENFCSEELAEALRGTLKVRNLLCCSACFLWFTSRRTRVSSVAFQWLIIGIATDGRKYPVEKDKNEQARRQESVHLPFPIGSVKAEHILLYFLNEFCKYENYCIIYVK